MILGHWSAVQSNSLLLSLIISLPPSLLSPPPSRHELRPRRISENSYKIIDHLKFENKSQKLNSHRKTKTKSEKARKNGPKKLVNNNKTYVYLYEVPDVYYGVVVERLRGGVQVHNVDPPPGILNLQFEAL